MLKLNQWPAAGSGVGVAIGIAHRFPIPITTREFDLGSNFVGNRAAPVLVIVIATVGPTSPKPPDEHRSVRYRAGS
jgi:hypothetical protein